MKTHDEITLSIRDKLSEERKNRVIHAMKRKRILISTACCLAAVVISAVAIWNFGGEIDPLPEEEVISQTLFGTTDVKTECYDFGKYVKAKNPNVKKEVTNSADTVAPFKNDAQMYEHSDLVIRGRVVSSQSIIDRRFGVTVYTKSTVMIEESFKGELTEGETVDVAEYGGFVSSKELSQAIELDKYDRLSEYEGEDELLDVRMNSAKVLEKDEEVILFLMNPQDRDSEDITLSCYENARLFQSKLYFDEEQGVYAAYVPAEEMELAEHKAYTLLQFREFIEGMK